MRVTSVSDQLRMAVTECTAARSFCANNIVTEIASAAAGQFARHGRDQLRRPRWLAAAREPRQFYRQRPCWLTPVGAAQEPRNSGFRRTVAPDRKSTRLNSSHLGISYA